MKKAYSAGKATTIRILLGLLRKDGGTVRLPDGDPWRDATTLHGRLAYVPGDVTPWPGLTGREIIDLLTRPRAEEAESRADPVLAGAVGRVRWGLGHVPAAAGAALLLAAAGLAAGLGYGLRAGDADGEAGRMLAAGLAQLPAALAIAGVATAAFGLLPRGSAAVGWTAAGLAVLISVFGQVLRLPRWVPDVLPFTHVPRLPGGPVSAPGLAWLSLIAFVLVVSGLAAPRRRDIG